MPNWCLTRYDFYGPEKDIKELHSKIEEWTSQNYMHNNFGEKWLGNVLIGAGFDYEKNTKHEIEKWGYLGCRGEIIYCDKPEPDGKDFHFSLDTETAWIPMPRLWFAIIEKFKWNIKFNFDAEEKGSNYYIRYYGDESKMPKEQEYRTDAYVCSDDITDEKLIELIIYFEESYSLQESILEKELRNYFNDNKSDLDSMISRIESIVKQHAKRNIDIHLCITKIEVCSKEEVIPIEN